MPKLKPKRLLSSTKRGLTSLSGDLDFFEKIFNRVASNMGIEPFKEDPSSLSIEGVVHSNKVDVGVQVAGSSDSTHPPSISGASDNVTIVDSSSEDDSNSHNVDRKENVLIESLMMKSVLQSIKTERTEDAFHIITIDNLPLKVTKRDVERDVFDLVGIDKKSLALDIQPNGTESFARIYTNNNRQVQKMLACDKKVVVGGRVIGVRPGSAGGP